MMSRAGKAMDWDVLTDSLRESPDTSVTDGLKKSLGPDGLYAVSFSNRIQVRDMNHGNQLLAELPLKWGASILSLNSVAVSPDKKAFAYLSGGDEVVVHWPESPPAKKAETKTWRSGLSANSALGKLRSGHF